MLTALSLTLNRPRIIFSLVCHFLRDVSSFISQRVYKHDPRDPITTSRLDICPIDQFHLLVPPSPQSLQARS
ncbi:hypothetical protein EDD17DRAFT_1573228 [Pisolithus thermaeus]|nr:hypothetical protein EDD17DRAFT_1573228 [Pisolithus thermaeus]